MPGGEANPFERPPPPPVPPSWGQVKEQDVPGPPPAPPYEPDEPEEEPDPEASASLHEGVFGDYLRAVGGFSRGDDEGGEGEEAPDTNAALARVRKTLAPSSLICLICLERCATPPVPAIAIPRCHCRCLPSGA